MDKKDKELNQNIENLIVVLKRANSFRYVFLKGVIWGLGSAIGATVVAVIIIAILSSIIQSINGVPILNSLIK